MIYLASQSPRRKELLQLITADFTVMPTDVNETVPTDIPVFETAQYLSRIKAEALYSEISNGDIVIGADTIVVLNNEIFGKPTDAKDAFEMLSKLSGHTHNVITGVTIIKKSNNRIIKTFSNNTEVTFYKLKNTEIQTYISTGEPFDKAGAYGIQGKGSLLIEKINGDYFNVVGLPVAKLAKELMSCEKSN